MQGWKLELFIFDTLPWASNLVLMEVKRAEHFAPVKNAPGSKSDSPDTARAAVLALHRRCASSVLIIPNDDIARVLEVFTSQPIIRMHDSALQHSTSNSLVLSAFEIVVY